MTFIRTQTSPAIGFMAGIGAALIWGAWPVLSRDAVIDGFAPLDIAMLRFGIAGLVLAPLILRNGFGGLGAARAMVLAAGAGAPYVFVTVTGLSLAPAGHGGVIIPCTMLTASTVGAWIFLKDPPSSTRLVGLAIIFCGIGLTAWSGMRLSTDIWSPDALLGDGLFMIGGVLWATYTVGSRCWRAEPFQATAAVSVLSMIIVLPIWLMAGGDAVMQAPLPALAWQAGFQGILVAIGALVFYTKAVAVFGAARGALFAILGPVFTVLLAIPVLGEVPSGLAVAGLIFCTSGMAVAFGAYGLALSALRKNTLSKPSSVPRAVSS
ncbi:DMT family transporter [Hwanghaeella grinnelliae]|uniref:DMT family transporter n=1 Tax=Hwanghaeella grinnelliae TaxID=2500179 RepID=A0A3S2VTI6_9PROT|nr:DMT family transporter [Hwanghaeella grinnelliae]RVU39447.1 DMT family transporter [Hwanghaeella grinnelliae]